MRRVVAALDTGHVVNQAILQSRLQQGNFDDYEVLRMAADGRDRAGAEWWALGRRGEVSVPPLAPALCNAIFAATDKRAFVRCR